MDARPRAGVEHAAAAELERVRLEGKELLGATEEDRDRDLVVLAERALEPECRSVIALEVIPERSAVRFERRQERAIHPCYWA
jgi:hypothetical protein